MVLGYLLVNYTSLADRKLTKQTNAIVFKIFLPCMLFYNVYQSDIGAEIHSRIKLCIWAAGGLLMLAISLIPYLFVLWQTPAQILSRYDI